MDHFEERTDLVTLSRFVLNEQGRFPESRGDLTILLNNIVLGCKFVCSAVNKAGLAKLIGLAGETNVQGEEQKKLDVLSNEVFVKALTTSGRTCILVSEEDEEAIITPAHLRGRPEALNMLQTELVVSIGRSGAEVLDSRETQILCGRLEDLQISLLRYPKTEKCDVKLKFYGLSAPEGGLLESVSCAGRENALTVTYVYCPLDEHLDWMLSATMSPCHVTVLRTSFDRFLHFLKSSQDLSPGVALETAAALQSKLEEVTRRAQEQLQLVLEQQSR